MSSSPVKVKICCIADIEEMTLAIKSGADAIGLVGPMPSGPGPISNEKIARIASRVPPGIESFLLTSETEPEAIIAHHRLTQTTTIQLVDHVETENYGDLRKALPGVKLIQVIHVLNEDSISESQKTAPFVDALLLDSGNPNLKVKQLGGTGRTHNWEISRQIVKGVTAPVFLAGGLNASNVRTAIETARPYGVDLCSGVRTNGKLDSEKLGAFMRAARPGKVI